VNCLQMQELCQQQACGGKADYCAQNCPDGCCDPNYQCQPGNADAACGSGGAACQDCTMLLPPTTCSTKLPVCAVCPTTYGPCPPNLLTPDAISKPWCSASELQSWGTACAQGWSTSSCQTYLMAHSQTSCWGCLGSFGYDFEIQTGVFNCLAPYVDATCNHYMSCDADCVSTSCLLCADATKTSQCIATAESGASCSPWVQAAQCIQQAYAGSGSFCNPANYADFGAWLQGVGTKYCGM
jgi:hypothetical protein